MAWLWVVARPQTPRVAQDTDYQEVQAAVFQVMAALTLEILRYNEKAIRQWPPALTFLQFKAFPKIVLCDDFLYGLSIHVKRHPELSGRVDEALQDIAKFHAILELVHDHQARFLSIWNAGPRFVDKRFVTSFKLWMGAIVRESKRSVTVTAPVPQQACSA